MRLNNQLSLGCFYEQRRFNTIDEQVLVKVGGVCFLCKMDLPYSDVIITSQLVTQMRQQGCQEWLKSQFHNMDLDQAMCVAFKLCSFTLSTSISRRLSRNFSGSLPRRLFLQCWNIREGHRCKWFPRTGQSWYALITWFVIDQWDNSQKPTVFPPVTVSGQSLFTDHLLFPLVSFYSDV